MFDILGVRRPVLTRPSCQLRNRLRFNRREVSEAGASGRQHICIQRHATILLVVSKGH